MTHTGIRTFEIVAYLTAPIECESMDDLPSHMQDQVYEALERKSKEVELPLTIVAVGCGIDHGETEDKDRPYIRIIASEIVVADEREIRHAMQTLNEKGLLQ